MTANNADVDSHELENMGIDELKIFYRDLTGLSAPKTLKTAMLRKLVAWHLDCIKYGTPHAEAFFYRQNAVQSVTPAIGTGDVFFREWGGRVHVVRRRSDGRFAYNDRTFSSLTRVAKEITGGHRSGPAFFGVKEG